ncbi:nucleotide sugar dehydrogenase [Annulohypoxylon truncatum]|uniref:nucleotide sugar dehydrogenase n=1 Tax=Annulohypoxylon truncatum TaxID=327061 RepID=UPI002008925D|nr:nucleotide sugar dehydrogenase [Annulohypoxylon truncatum]KAI1206570.1 nucleotide sugar dehydrogenase [Annulohypoxylon truncatum]
MHRLVVDDVVEDVRGPFSVQDLSLAIKALKQSDTPSQETSPPRTPQYSTFQFEADGLSDLKPASIDRIREDEEPLVAVIGCGYVGTQLIGSFSTQYDVLGFDVSKEQLRRVEAEHGGEGSRATFTLDPRDLSKATHFLISVPTLLKADKTIDTSYVKNALSNIRTYARAGSTVVIESSVAIGMTRQLLGPLAQEKGFFAGMSPERVDPGRTDPPMKTIPKVLSGLDDVVPGSLNAIIRLYSRVFDTIVPVSTPETAEMTKLYENCQRMVAIAYANEMADACLDHGIDPYEVCKAASTKPFGYTPFTPSLGVGGHCIPVNPYYLLSNSQFPFLKMATETMWQRPERIGQRALDVLFQDKPQTSQISQFKGIRPRVLVVGVGFKAGQSHLSNSPGLKLIQTLADSRRVDVMFADALVEQSAIPNVPRLDMDDWNTSSLEGFDMIIVSFKQTGMDFKILEELNNVKVEMWCP